MGRQRWGDDGRVAFWPRHLLTLRPAASDGTSLSADAEKVLEFLRKNGASFLVDLQIALTLDDTETALALCELVFAGKVSNDQLEGLRRGSAVGAECACAMAGAGGSVAVAVSGVECAAGRGRGSWRGGGGSSGLQQEARRVWAGGGLCCRSRNPR